MNALPTAAVVALLRRLRGAGNSVFVVEPLKESFTGAVEVRTQSLVRII